MQRSVVSLLVAMVLMIGLIPSAAAQDATPASALDGLDLPTLDITVTATGYEGIPAEVEAGRYLVTVTATEDTEFGGGVASLCHAWDEPGPNFLSGQLTSYESQNIVPDKLRRIT